MLKKDFDNIDLSDIRRLVENKIPESRYIEYKSQLYGGTDADAKEFSADICSLANASGGDLIIGVKEDDGEASSCDGVVVKNVDNLILNIQQSIISGIEPILSGVRVKWISVHEDTGVLIIRVPHSWNGPHRVVKNSKFFIRHENGKYPMSIDEIRDHILSAGSIDSKIKNFREDRANMIKNDMLPVQLSHNSPYLMFHIIPRRSFLQKIDIHPSTDKFALIPLGSSGSNPFYSSDGIVSYSGEWTKDGPKGSASTLFRNGIIESVSKIRTYEMYDRKFLQLNAVEQWLVKGLKHMLNIIEHEGLSSSVFASMTLINVAGFSGRYSDRSDNSLFYPCRRNDLFFPEIEINTNHKSHVNLRPIFDIMWQAFGKPGSPNYSKEGKWSISYS